MPRGNDGKFGTPSTRNWLPGGVAAQRVPFRTSLCNAHTERWIRSLRSKCLDHVMPLGTRHLDHLVAKYLKHYHTERPH